MAEEVTALALSLVAGFAVAVLYFSMRSELSPYYAALASAIVIVGAPVSLIFGKNAPLVSALLGLAIAVGTDALSKGGSVKKKRGG